MSFWDEQRIKFKQKLATGNMEEFKTWDEVRAVPLYHPNELYEQYLQDNLLLLKTLYWWQEVFNMGEPKVGHTEQSYQQVVRQYNGIETTAWAQKSLHHCLQFEALMPYGTNITNYDNIIEFGAGIGDTARTIFNKGFRGRYHIIDLPEIHQISKYYISNVHRGADVSTYDSVENLPFLPGKNLFIATWSLSEVDFALREKIARYLKGADCLIVFQNQIFGRNNVDYFLFQWPQLFDVFVRLRYLEFHKGDGGNFYLVGKNLTSNK